jgi:tRNA(Arg) A34 adenosine deaminase TadA
MEQGAIVETDDKYMAEALALARQAAGAGEVPVGAVVVCDGRIVGRGHNRSISAHDPTAHAEVVALRDAAQTLGNYRLEGCTLYVTVEPCAMCAQAALHARLARVVYGAPEPRMGAAGSVVDLFAQPALNAHTAVLAGVRADEAAALMREFFARRRAEQRAQAQPLRDDALRAPAQAFEAIWAQAARWGISPQHSHARQDLPELEGLRLHWLDVGPAASTPPWVCLHGPRGWWPQWLPWVTAQLQAGERVLMPDLIGFGQSDKPKKASWHSPERHAEILRAWLDALDVSDCRLAWAPGAQWLLPALHTALGARIRATLSVADADLMPEQPDWVDAPFPDPGHRAGQRAWAAAAR